MHFPLVGMARCAVRDALFRVAILGEPMPWHYLYATLRRNPARTAQRAIPTLAVRKHVSR